MNTIKQDRLIKQLRSQLSEIESKIEGNKILISNTQKELTLNLKNKSSIEQKLSEISKSNTGIKLSEHALIRYFERVKGLNVQEIENEIISDDLKRMVETLGLNGTYPFGEYQLVIKNGVIVTIK